MVAEYQLVSGVPTLKKEYGQRNGQLLIVADATNSNCQWLVTDALGTPHIIADQTGSLSAIKRHDYLPFGEVRWSRLSGHKTLRAHYSRRGYKDWSLLHGRQSFMRHPARCAAFLARSTATLR